MAPGYPSVSIPTIQKTTRKHSDRSSKASSVPDHKGSTYVSSSGSHTSSSANCPHYEEPGVPISGGKLTGVIQTIRERIRSPQQGRHRNHQGESLLTGSSPKSDRHGESSAGGKARKSMGGARRSDQKRNSHSTKSPERFSEKAPDTRKQQSNPIESSMAKTDAKGLAAQPEQHTHQGSPSAHSKEGQGSFVVIDDRAIVEEPETYYHHDQGQKDQQQLDPDQSIRTSNEVENITRKYYKYKRRAGELDEEVATLKSENGTLRDLLSKDAASKNLMGGMGAGKCHLQDSDIYQQWKQLAWWIRQCVHVANDASKQKNAEGATNRSRQVGDHKEKSSPKKRSSRSKSKSRRETAERESHGGSTDALIIITPYYEEFLDTDKQRMALAEAAIWKTLLEKDIFTTSSSISRMEWAGRYAHSIRPMLADCFEHRRTSREFHSWRCHTATFLASLTSRDDVLGEVNPVVELLKSRLKLIFDIESAVLNHELKNIVLNAFKLDKQLCQQQALWFCEDPSKDAWASPSQAESGDELSAAVKSRSREVWFEDRLMTVTDARKEKLGKSAAVTLIICPALMKAGNSYGEDYDVPQVQARCEVVISRNAPKLATSAPRSAPAPMSKPMPVSSSKAMLPSSAAPTSGIQSRSAPGQHGMMETTPGMMKVSPRVEFDMSDNSSRDSDYEE
ncbi:hypothetical protein QBC32DRAFT_337042 [Pseudoneurospora amorphoporcata]|uniref:Uncharacterized protein n=1 Tax=Pseudoneurospora amorphoporcata TaxID=241081 RepID=A0AAN6P233_9PEZI|nr:hypothetical protein QBC32DRAFT_337042 [Pseudoneurospora amorphoporcata]